MDGRTEGREGKGRDWEREFGKTGVGMRKCGGDGRGFLRGARRPDLTNYVGNIDSSV